VEVGPEGAAEELPAVIRQGDASWDKPG
jgi:hypothetical protein